MKIDVLRYIGAVTREVRSCDYEGRPARVVVATCAYDTTITDVWDAITNAERISRWFLPISGDLRLGGRYQLQGNASGQVIGCEPPRSLAVKSVGFASGLRNCRMAAHACNSNISPMFRMNSGTNMVPAL